MTVIKGYNSGTSAWEPVAVGADVTNTLTTKGDLLGRTSSAASRLGVGSNGTVLTADSAEATGLKWATPAAPTFVGCLAATRASQTVSNNTFTAVNLATEIYDTDNFHSTSTNTSRFTIPTGKGGNYLFFATGGVDAFTGGLGVRFAKNGTNFSTAYFNFSNPSSGLSVGSVTSILNLAAGDYVQLVLIQNSGSDKGVAISGSEDFTFMGCTYLGA